MLEVGKFWQIFFGSGKSDVDVEVKRLVLSYMNGIQAIYLLPSLQQEIDISIVRMEMWTHGDPYNSYQVCIFVQQCIFSLILKILSGWQRAIVEQFLWVAGAE